MIAQTVGDDDATADVLCGVGCPPADDRRPAPVLGQDVPDCFGLSVMAAHRHPLAVGLVDHEPGDPVFVRGLAGRDAGPDDGGERDVVQCLYRSRRPTSAKTGEIGHPALGGKRVDQFPVGAVDTDDDGPRVEIPYVGVGTACAEDQRH